MASSPHLTSFAPDESLRNTSPPPPYGRRELNNDRTVHPADDHHRNSLESEENKGFERKASLIQRSDYNREREIAVNVRMRELSQHRTTQQRINASHSQQYPNVQPQRGSSSPSRDSRPGPSLSQLQNNDTPRSYSSHSYAASRVYSHPTEPYWIHSNSSYQVSNNYHRPSYRHSVHSPHDRMHGEFPRENTQSCGEPSGESGFSDSFDTRAHHQGGYESGNFYQYQHQHLHHHYIERRSSPTSMPEYAIPVPLECSPKISPQGASRQRYGHQIGKDRQYTNHPMDNIPRSPRTHVEQRPPTRPTMYDQHAFQSYAPSYESFERWYSNRPQTSATWNRDQHVYHDPYPAQPVHDRWPLHSNPSVAAYEAGIPGHPGFHQSSFSANDVVVSSAIASAVGAANSTVIAVSNDFATSASSSSATATSAKSLNSESSRLNESTVESRPRSYHPATTRILDTESSSHGGALPMDDEEDGGRLISDEHGPGKTSLTVNTRIPENSKLDERNDMSTTESSTVLNVEAIEQVMDYCDIIRNLAKIVQNSGNGEDAANNEEDFEQIVADLVAKVGEFHQFIQDCQFTFSMEAQNEESEFDKTKHPTSPPRPKYQKRNRSMPRPGRCHSCNISETPEWRRGPDGARTLCNACGLHFAKLMRKRQRLRADLSDNGSGGDSTGGFGGRSSGSPAVLVGAGDAADEQVLHRLQSFAKRREDENAHRTQRRHNLAPLSIPRHASPQNQKRTRRPFDNPPEDAMTTSNDSSTMLDNRGRKEDGLDDRPVQVHDSTSGAGTDVAQEDMGTGSGRKKLRTA